MSNETTALAHQETGTVFERHAWKALLGVSVIIGLFGVGDMLGGASDLQSGEAVMMRSITRMTWNELQAASPKVANLIDLKFRTEGASLTTVALLSIAVCLIGFRQGKRWAWYALWALPLWMALTVFIFLRADRERGAGTPIPILSGSLLLIISALALGLSARKFFKRHEPDA